MSAATEGDHDIGLIGLAVMGQNLVQNIASRGYQVSVYNRTAATTRAFTAAHPGAGITGFDSLEGFVASLRRPRKILIMVKAGAAVDAVIDQLIPLLSPGDTVVDCGNSLYTDTELRDARMSALGFNFVGAGVSGGEEGARKGPSIMPGGPEASWRQLQPIFEAIAAQVDGQPCVVHIGPGGAGHYVKMVHNGIEYGDMQLICEAYSLLQAAGLSTDEMAAVFARWNEGELQSYLVQITGLALAQRDPATGRPLVDLIDDRAGQKGTGQWTLVNAAQNAVVISTINAAVEARVMSSHQALRLQASPLLHGPSPALAVDRHTLVDQVHDALYASKIVSYAQGLDLMQTMSDQKGWALDLGAIARIWRGGCIIRARFLNRITEAYQAAAASGQPVGHLMLSPFFQQVLGRSQPAWRQVVGLAVTHGIPVPAFSASLAYYDSLRSARLPANLLQAQRDFFGAHTYQRTDRPAGEWFHTEWPQVID